MPDIENHTTDNKTALEESVTLSAAPSDYIPEMVHKNPFSIKTTAQQNKKNDDIPIQSDFNDNDTPSVDADAGEKSDMENTSPIEHKKMYRYLNPSSQRAVSDNMGHINNQKNHSDSSPVDLNQDSTASDNSEAALNNNTQVFFDVPNIVDRTDTEVTQNTIEIIRQSESADTDLVMERLIGINPSADEVSADGEAVSADNNLPESGPADDSQANDSFEEILENLNNMSFDFSDFDVDDMDSDDTSSTDDADAKNNEYINSADDAADFDFYFDDIDMNNKKDSTLSDDETNDYNNPHLSDIFADIRENPDFGDIYASLIDDTDSNDADSHDVDSTDAEVIDEDNHSDDSAVRLFVSDTQDEDSFLYKHFDPPVTMDSDPANVEISDINPSGIEISSFGHLIDNNMTENSDNSSFDNMTINDLLDELPDKIDVLSDEENTDKPDFTSDAENADKLNLTLDAGNADKPDFTLDTGKSLFDGLDDIIIDENMNSKGPVQDYSYNSNSSDFNKTLEEDLFDNEVNSREMPDNDMLKNSKVSHSITSPEYLRSLERPSLPIRLNHEAAYLEKIAEKYNWRINTGHTFFINNGSTAFNNQFENALSFYARMEKNEFPILIYDSTARCNASYGFVLSNHNFQVHLRNYVTEKIKLNKIQTIIVDFGQNAKDWSVLSFKLKRNKNAIPVFRSLNAERVIEIADMLLCMVYHLVPSTKTRFIINGVIPEARDESDSKTIMTDILNAFFGKVSSKNPVNEDTPSHEWTAEYQQAHDDMMNKNGAYNKESPIQQARKSRVKRYQNPQSGDNFSSGNVSFRD